MDQAHGSRGVAVRLHGVRVRVDWSFLFLVGLVFWSLEAGVFPQAYPGLSVSSRIGLAVLGTLLMVGSLTLHELCHSWQSLREGVEVREITLWLLGGVSQVARPVESPAAEFRIVAAGPACTAVLTVVFMAAAGASYALGAPDAFTGVIVYAAWINLVLLVFNLVPALPLDGGRLVHALLWRRSGDRDRATLRAGTLGQVLAAGLIGVGVLLGTVWADAVSGLWMVLIGWYLLASARREEAAARRSSRLERVRAADLLPAGSVVIGADSTLAELTDLLCARPDVNALPVASAGRLVGALVLKDAGQVPLESRSLVQVRDVMRPITALPRVAATASGGEVVRLLQEGAPAVVVVGDAGTPLDTRTGVVTAADLEEVIMSG